MDKQAESRRLRRELLQMYNMKLELIKAKKSVKELQEKIDNLAVRVARFEDYMSKNLMYRAIDMQIELEANPVIGCCTRCGKQITKENKYQIRNEEGLFDNRYCRDQWRKAKATKKAVG
ncbi:hypothetical protein [Paenibacillus sp. FSL K6-1230]|uniref:hypothetical protein n=1 Tax=Paenibacillus sp. FSL K6-1230 TaxID=2921603 RepID=UPI0030FA57A0